VATATARSNATSCRRPTSPAVPLLLACAVLSLAACRRRDERAEQPALAVVVVVDQLRGDEIELYEPLWRHGFRRLLEEGRFYRHAMLPYGRTETAAGHATIASGVAPRLHGIVDKRFFDAEKARVTPACAPDPSGCGPQNLRVATLGDRLKAARPDARVVALAAKPRSATLLGGQNGDIVAWVDAGRSRMTGRRGAQPGIPQWLERFYTQVAGPDRIAHIWELPRLPEPFASRADAAPSEMDPGHGTTFPHRLPAEATRDDHYWGWFCTPDADRAIVDMAGQIIRHMQLGRGKAPDLLLVSLGAFDSIGHAFGPDSLERAAALTELDTLLGDLLDVVHAAAGRRALVAVTSDHGIAPTVAAARAQGHASARVSADELVQIVEHELAAQFGPGPHVAAALIPFITLRDIPAAAHRKAASSSAAALLRHPAVRRAWATAELGRRSDPLAQLMAESAYPGRTGDVAVVLEPYHAVETRWRGKAGAEHGTPWPYDRHVPILLWGNRVSAGRVDADVSLIDLTRTLGDRLGLRPVAGGGEPLP
jgi:hypothetical protein